MVGVRGGALQHLSRGPTTQETTLFYCIVMKYIIIISLTNKYDESVLCFVKQALLRNWCNLVL